MPQVNFQALILRWRMKIAKPFFTVIPSSATMMRGSWAQLVFKLHEVVRYRSAIYFKGYLVRADFEQ